MVPTMISLVLHLSVMENVFFWCARRRRNSSNSKIIFKWVLVEKSYFL
jgi:hypothetical protein